MLKLNFRENSESSAREKQMQKKKRNISQHKSGKSYVTCLPEDEKDHSHLMTENNRAHEVEKLISESVKQRPSLKSSTRIKRKIHVS